MDKAAPPSALPRLSVMMFLQFFAWGSWFATLALAMGGNGLGDFIGRAYESAPIGAIFAPLFLGLIADRLFSSERVMGVLMIIGGILVAAVAVIAPQGAAKGDLMVWLMIGYMLCYMPTLGLGNTITFTHLRQEDFPKARVWGTIGWIVAGLTVGAVGWSASLNIFWLGAASSLALGLYSFTLPHTPPPAKGKPLDLGSLLMVDAFKLLKNPPFLVFALCSMLICIPLAYYYGQTSAYLGAAGFKQAASTMTLGQMSEIVFMLLIPFFFRKLGVKMMLLIGMLSWVARYALFAFGAPDQVAWMLLAGVALHGICYDFFFVTGFIYTDKKAPAEIRGQAQSLLVFLTQGLGMFFGFRMAFGQNFPLTEAKLPNTLGAYGAAPAEHPQLIEQIKGLSGTATPSFFESLAGMFGKAYPAGIDSALVAKVLGDWKNYWIFPAGMAAVIAIIFFLGFWDKSADGEDAKH
ncbi:nucleoside permease [Luteolibacter sp. GHJ8]|uniref:Nucleoside permease n=1 Tax=Luteolibacter rhizosphaerae TaxID=2989719 RepID=A0ABT3G0J7_9BACT|nr:nucleoside permease [Luteolibacter rhizosphaerae]MCW1913187.1 nucleoside permease [Luteolibacter rhizosphaerae]